MTAVLVTGGAGYIGGQAVLALLDAGYAPVVLDDLSTGLRDAVPPGVPLVVGDVADAGLVARTLRAHRAEAVMHFAASLVVPESVAHPLAYWRNNLAGTLGLLESCVAAGVRRLVFSSTAAVYGIPEVLPVREDVPCRPINPYGASKLAAERLIGDASAAHGLSFVALRYFNVAGADPAGRTGRRRPAATHLIATACDAALGRRDSVTVYGDDYDTPDGTGVRDYVHVADLATAHVAALRHLLEGGGNLTLNCGYGRGHSVLAVLRAVERAAGRSVPHRIAPRRPGDPPALVAVADGVRQILGWRPVHDSLDRIVGDALAWEGRRAAPSLLPGRPNARAHA
ncbi:UDP-glucose 4-epimerase GalE [Roseomonas indoligenes]|uniref:UDP-glucose 4-epimerase n=1 Tax=Roseomonas indoligenes TaxID=2820811 RepID=A0A940MV20_9PROT|nr:UDP-glucose 4-epimerase GalE [Pararoseomonas indoligenes]MBP0491762.1 UDP-glucose 4-epimerase GalE [Pararoseomonas indoligenes]